DGEHFADRRPLVLSFDKRIAAAEHQKTAAAAADELLQQRKLILRKEAGFQIVEDDSVVAEQFGGAPGKSVAKLILILGPQADQHRLVVLFDLFVLLIAESAKERVGPFTRLTEKRELRFAPGNPHKSDEIDFVILVHRAAQEFEFPVR